MVHEFYVQRKERNGFLLSVNVHWKKEQFVFTALRFLMWKDKTRTVSQ